MLTNSSSLRDTGMLPKNSLHLPAIYKQTLAQVSSAHMGYHHEKKVS